MEFCSESLFRKIVLFWKWARCRSRFIKNSEARHDISSGHVDHSTWAGFLPVPVSNFQVHHAHCFAARYVQMFRIEHARHLFLRACCDVVVSSMNVASSLVNVTMMPFFSSIATEIEKFCEDWTYKRLVKVYPLVAEPAFWDGLHFLSLFLKWLFVTHTNMICVNDFWFRGTS